jgi:hypothetical protein
MRISASQEPTASTTTRQQIHRRMLVWTVKLDTSATLHFMTTTPPSHHSTSLAPKSEQSARVERFVRLAPTFPPSVLQEPTN